MTELYHRLHKVLIINRGEIALRAIRACHELGLECGVVYSPSDEMSQAVKFADRAHALQHVSGEGLP